MKKSPWQRQLRVAKFRNAEFRVESHSGAGGRRIQDHEFPNRDEPYTEDLGRKQRKFTIQGYIVDKNYMRARDALIAALEKEGPGELVHPYLGTKTVECPEFTFTESTSNGGMVTFSMTFHETGRKSLPVGSLDALSRIGGASDALSAAAGGDFLSSFDVLNAPGNMITSATGMVERVADVFDNSIVGIGADPIGLASLAFAVRNLKANAGDLIRNPAELRSQLSSIFETLRTAVGLDKLFGRPSADTIDPAAARLQLKNDAISKARTRRAVYAEIQKFGDDVPLPRQGTLLRKRETINQMAITRLVKSIALAEASRNAAEDTFATTDEANAVRDELVATSDVLLEQAGPTIEPQEPSAELQVESELQRGAPSDTAFSAIKELQAALFAAVPDPEGDTPSVSTYVPPAPTNSLLLVYDLYDSPLLEADIVLRNKLARPAFIEAQTPIEVVNG